MMKRFADYLLANPIAAALIVLLLGLVPLLGWLGLVIMAFITLRNGPKAGLLPLVAAVIPDFIWAAMGHPQALLFGVLGSGVYVWAMAALLSLTASWSLVIQATTILGIIAVAVTHWLHPDIVAWWLAKYQDLLQRLVNDAALAERMIGSSEEIEIATFVQMLRDFGVVETTAKISSGLIASLLLVGNLFNLGIARAWQAVLFNPKGFWPEVRAMRLGFYLVLLFVATMAAARFGQWPVAIDCLPVFGVAFAVTGICLMHSLACLWPKGGTISLVVMYVLLILFPPTLLSILITAAVLDSFVDVRQRLVKH